MTENQLKNITLTAMKSKYYIIYSLTRDENKDEAFMQKNKFD